MNYKTKNFAVKVMSKDRKSQVRIPLSVQETWVQSLGWEDSPGEGNGTPLKYSCLENPMDGGAW